MPLTVQSHHPSRSRRSYGVAAFCLAVKKTGFIRGTSLTLDATKDSEGFNGRYTPRCPIMAAPFASLSIILNERGNDRVSE